MDFCGLVKTSTLDYPGKIAAVLFSPGCNYDCFYCHNRELLQKGTPLLNPADIMGFLEKRRGLLDGVVLTGGEAALQNGVAPFAQSLKDMGYLVKLDTNGSRPDAVKELLNKNLLDYAAVDFKAPWGRYTELCGNAADPEEVKKTLELLIKSGVDFEVRTTVIPQLSEEDLMQMAREAPKVPRFLLKQYREPALYKTEDLFRIKQKPYGPDFLAGIAEKMRFCQPGAAVR
jgi:pyruvate formate lyase activating enzyme